MRRTRRVFARGRTPRRPLPALGPGRYSPVQVKSAYGLDEIDFTTVTDQKVAADGTGEVIAIVVAYHDPNLASDLATFDPAYGLADRR